MKKFSVVFIDNSERESKLHVYLFDTYEKACDFLEKMWQDRFNDMIADFTQIDEEESYHEDQYAQLKEKEKKKIIYMWHVADVMKQGEEE